MITVSSLSKQYGRQTVVNDLSFSVQPGLVTGFLGPNGAGKSTTMRMIVGLDKPTTGTALIDGKPYSAYKEPLRKVGTLLDAKWVHPKRSARAHLQWIAAANGIAKSRVDEVLSFVGLTDVASRQTGQFSLGMGQRLGLAAALLGDPEMLILDEPVNGLDPEGIRWVRGFIRNLAAEGRTVLVSSHLLSEMALTADHLIVIGQGKLISDSSTQEFIRSASQSTSVVRAEEADLARLESALQREGLQVERQADAEQRPTLVVQGATDAVGALAFREGVALRELSEQQSSLEEAFMKITGDAVQYQATQFDVPQGGK